MCYFITHHHHLYIYIYSEDRIRKSCEKLKKNVKQATQSRMMDFFKATPSTITNKKRVIYKYTIYSYKYMYNL